ncbi:MAG: DASS family sodium-coupled anion symporter, partial [Desulfatirhabdiaceae bacterium]
MTANQTPAIQETLSETEEQFEKWRNTVGLFLGPVVAALLYLTDMPQLSHKAHLLAAVLGWTVVWWVCEPIPLGMTALASSVMCVVLGVEDAKKVFAPYADPIIYLFLGGFMLAEAMAIHGLDKRFAYGIMSSRLVGNSTGRILGAFGLICAFLSMWISNTASTAMMFPIALGIVYAMSDIMARQQGKTVNPLKLRFGTGLMLMAAYAASTGGIATPVGTPPNIIGIALIDKALGIKISFFHWMTFALPLTVILCVVLFILLYFLHKPEIATLEGSMEYVSQEKVNLGKWTAGQRNALFAFLVTVTLWIIPGILAIGYGDKSEIAKAYNRMMPEGVAALVGALLLFILPTNWKKREFTITWKQAVRIDWGTLLLFGGGITLGSLMFESRLAEVIGKGLLSISGATSTWGITLGAVFIAILVSETSSNTASANMVVPVMIALAQAANMDPVPPAIGATLGASWGFMMPVSTPPNAIVYGSGMVPITRMIRAGIIYDMVGGLTIWIGLYILLPLVGLS